MTNFFLQTSQKLFLKIAISYICHPCIPVNIKSCLNWRKRNLEKKTNSGLLQPLRNLVSLQPMVVELPHLQNLITSECSLWVQLNKYYNLTINLIFLLSKINLIHIWISYFNIPWLKLAKMRERAYLSSAALVHTLSLSISNFFHTLSLSISNFFLTLSLSI